MPRASNNEIRLAGWYVISLRPLNQHAGVRRAAMRAGARTFALSTLRLCPLDAKPALRAALACPRVIVSSPAAVRLADAQVPLSKRRGQRWFALGAGSALALQRRGIDGVRIPAAGSDSEALLAHPDLQDVKGQAIGLLTAPGGRGLLAERLTARGAQVRIAEVYQREALAVAPSRLRAMARLQGNVALFLTSLEAFDPLWRSLTPPLRKHLLARPCVVASDRLAALAASLGFKKVLRASDARPTSLVATLASHVQAGRIR